jgi:iron complex outermembrane receptor protein
MDFCGNGLDRYWRLGSVSALALAASTGIAQAQTAPVAAPDAIQEITVVAQAIRVSPSSTPTDVVQPTSVIEKQFIQNNIIPLASFDDIIKFAPSVFDQSPNGPGLGKSETLSIRGFQDGQYNVTFDGIPFGDATDLHHTSSALFIAHDLAAAEVDRGPGGGSTIGNATFGGTIGFRTKDPLNTATLNPYFTSGTWDTQAVGTEIDTGLTPYGKAFFDYDHETSNGYLTNARELRTNLQFKYVWDISDALRLTVLSSYNHSFEYTTQGTTLANIQAYGPSFGLGDDPRTQNYFRYQPSNYYSNFQYIDLQAKLGHGIKVQDTVYTDGFGHSYTESKDASDTNAADNGVTFYNAAGVKGATFKTDVPGKLADAGFQTLGNIFRLTDDLPFGQLQSGVWFDQQHDGRYSYATDLTQGNIPVPAKNGSAYSYQYKDVNTTIQPYLQFDWKVTPQLTISPGVKYDSFDRDVHGPFNKTTKLPIAESVDFSETLPSIAARYAITPTWSAYAQAAKGFLAPPITVLQEQQVAQVSPETTWNYQIGTAAHIQRLILGADLYYIDFSNFLAQSSVSTPTGVMSTYANAGGAVYKGVEIEAQYVLDHGYSLYANATGNSAKYKDTDVSIAESPDWTAAAGVLFDDKKGPYWSFIAKWIGPRYGLDNTLSTAGKTVLGDSFHLTSFVTADLAAGWRFKTNFGGVLKEIVPSVKISNIFDSRKIDDYAGNQSAVSAAFPSGQPLFFTVAGRAIFFNLTANFQ